MLLLLIVFQVRGWVVLSPRGDVLFSLPPLNELRDKFIRFLPLLLNVSTTTDGARDNLRDGTYSPVLPSLRRRLPLCYPFLCLAYFGRIEHVSDSTGSREKSVRRAKVAVGLEIVFKSMTCRWTSSRLRSGNQTKEAYQNIV